MNKKGFTLTELLAVIVILGVLLTIAVPSVLYINDLLKDNMYDKKLKFIEQAAQLYGQDNADYIPETAGGIDIKVKELRDSGYVDKDNDKGDVLDPRNNRNMICDVVNVRAISMPSGKRIVVKSTPIERDTAAFDNINPSC